MFKVEVDSAVIEPVIIDTAFFERAEDPFLLDSHARIQDTCFQSSLHQLLPPIFLFHGRKLHGGGLERSDLKIDAAIGAHDDLTSFGSCLQFDLGSAFGTSYSRHVHSPLIF
jgi:hypothetical protein